jgi:hypothetical protein
MAGSRNRSAPSSPDQRSSSTSATVAVTASRVMIVCWQLRRRFMRAFHRRESGDGAIFAPSAK